MARRVNATLDVLSTILAIVAASVLLWRLLQPTPQFPGARPPVEAVSGLTIDARKATNVRGDGRVVLVEFADYECPFCARHTITTGPIIESSLVTTGQIQHVFFNFPLDSHPRAQKAGEAAECAAKQGRFWEMHRLLFENPDALDPAALVARAERLELDREAFGLCLESGDTADKVRGDLAEGRRLGVNSTPSFFIGVRRSDGAIDLVKRLNGAIEFELFESAVKDVSSTMEGNPRDRGDRAAPVG